MVNENLIFNFLKEKEKREMNGGGYRYGAYTYSPYWKSAKKGFKPYFKKKKRSKWSPVKNQLFAYSQPQGIQTGAPAIRTVKLRYCSVIGLQSVTGAIARYNFRANSVYDPDYTSTGHQPMGFDTWASQYNHYIVKGSKIRVTAVDSDATSTNNHPMYWGITLKADPSNNHITVGPLLEQDKCYKICTNENTPQVLSRNFSAKKFFNVTNVKDNFSRFGSAVNANPFDECFFQVWAVVMNGAETSQLNLDVCIEYIVEFSEPRLGIAS